MRIEKQQLHVAKHVSWVVQVLEVVAETEAPLLPYEELLAGAVCEEPQAERGERLNAAAAAKAELAAASERVSAAAMALGAVLASCAQQQMQSSSFVLKGWGQKHSEDMCM